MIVDCNGSIDVDVDFNREIMCICIFVCQFGGKCFKFGIKYLIKMFENICVEKKKTEIFRKVSVKKIQMIDNDTYIHTYINETNVILFL